MEHVVPLRVYYAVFAALLVLTGVTVAVAFLDLGSLNAALALGIACGKALLVVLFFMHVRYSPALVWLVAGAGFFWLAILLVLTMADLATRGWLPVPGK